MQTIDSIYINGTFVRPHGSEVLTQVDPVTEELTAQMVEEYGGPVRTSNATARRAAATTSCRRCSHSMRCARVLPSSAR